MLGLAWSAVDLDARTVTITAGRVSVKGGTELGAPKSWRSARTLPISADLTDALRAFRTAQARERLVIGAGWPDTGLVAVNADGTPIRPETYSSMFRRLVADAGIPAIPLKGVRNTAATTLIGAGLSPVDAAAWLGHDPAMTLRVYAHAREEGPIAAADVLSRPS
ncbi:site-specific integrase [Skermania piniformis]|uniref:Site-specific integrase n=1 Tax=Skermania pinensis TaxID=39122 RepID=A0ABX8S6D7_9ACTN|nr:site-specific integrase [Skermania piniformis]QXQ12816.1 site-specific integrase [Skermania piniformis]